MCSVMMRQKENISYYDDEENKLQCDKSDRGVAAKFSVQSFRKVSGQVVTGGVAEVSGTPKSLSGLAKQVHGRYFNATLRRNSTGTLAGSGAKKVLKKGTKVTATARSSKVVTVIMKDGTRVRVKVLTFALTA